MKTSELIRHLQELDPSGELEVAVGNYTVVEPFIGSADLGGPYESIELDEVGDPVSAKFVVSGQVVQLYTMSIEEAIHEDPNLVVDLRELHDRHPDLAFKFEEEVKRWVDDSNNLRLEFNISDLEEEL